MTNSALITSGAIIGIAVGAASVAVIIALAIGIFVLLKKRTGKNDYRGSKDFVEFVGDNSELLKVIDAGTHIRSRATVIVPPTHHAIVIRNGSIVNVHGEGEYPLNESGAAIRSLKIVYISKTAKVTVNWGTKLHQRIEYLDPKVGKPVSVGAFGVMDVRVSDPKKFYLELVANFGQTFSAEDLQERIRTLAVDDTFRAIGKTLNEKKLSYIEFTSAKYDIQTQVGAYLSDKFTDEFGFSVSNFIIENLNITKEQEEEIKQIYAEDSSYERDKVLYDRKREVEERERLSERRRKEAIREDKELDDFLYEHERDRAREEDEYERKKRHEDEDRAWAREDKERESEERLRGKYLDTVKEVEKSKSEAEKLRAQSGVGASASNAGHHCSICGASYKPNAKYCPDCGALLPREDIASKCPDCGSEVPWGTAFCPRCGHKFNK